MRNGVAMRFVVKGVNNGCFNNRSIVGMGVGCVINGCLVFIVMSIDLYIAKVNNGCLLNLKHIDLIKEFCTVPMSTIDLY